MLLMQLTLLLLCREPTEARVNVSMFDKKTGDWKTEKFGEGIVKKWIRGMLGRNKSNTSADVKQEAQSRGLVKNVPRFEERPKVHVGENTNAWSPADNDETPLDDTQQDYRLVEQGSATVLVWVQSSSWSVGMGDVTVASRNHMGWQKMEVDVDFGLDTCLTLMAKVKAVASDASVWQVERRPSVPAGERNMNAWSIFKAVEKFITSSDWEYRLAEMGG
jgi:hypothetical protein